MLASPWLQLRHLEDPWTHDVSDHTGCLKDQNLLSRLYLVSSTGPGFRPSLDRFWLGISTFEGSSELIMNAGSCLRISKK